jgi:phenylacetate-CoA ligase
MNYLNKFMFQSFQILVFKLKNYFFRKSAVKQYQESLYNCDLAYEGIKDLNFKKRKKLISYAYQNIKFYKEYYDKMKFNPAMLKSEKDWEQVPILEKEMVRLHIDDIKNPLVSDNYMGSATTGGSTGHPLKIYTDKRFHFEILGWRAFSWWNISPSANIGIVHRRTPESFLGKLKNRLLWWPTKRIYLNASSITEKDLLIFTSSINKRNIEWLQGYAGGLEKVAEYILQNSIQISTLKVVWSTSSPLPKNVRKKLEKAFNCGVMDQYGSNEIPNIAIQCPHSENLHINYDYVHLEVLNSRGNLIYNLEGEIFVTNLESYAFPLIKYRIGDRGCLINERCKCENPLPLIKSIKGRVSDSICTPRGLYLDGDYLTTIFDDFTDLIDQFQIIQNEDYSLTIYVKTYTQSNSLKETLNKIKLNLEKKVENEIPIEIKVVKKIEDDKGKIRYIISKIKHEA